VDFLVLFFSCNHNVFVLVDESAIAQLKMWMLFDKANFRRFAVLFYAI